MSDESSSSSSGHSRLHWLGDHQVGRDVQMRPAHATEEWPEGASYRVIFNDTSPGSSASASALLPFTEYYTEDGWPLHTPAHLKSQLGSELRELLNRHPFRLLGEEVDDQTWLEVSAECAMPDRTRAERLRSLGIDPAAIRTVLRRVVIDDVVRQAEERLSELTAELPGALRNAEGSRK